MYVVDFLPPPHQDYVFTFTNESPAAALCWQGATTQFGHKDPGDGNGSETSGAFWPDAGSSDSSILKRIAIALTPYIARIARTAQIQPPNRSFTFSGIAYR